MKDQERPAVIAVEQEESIRTWFQRTTKKARTAIGWATLVSIPVIVLMGALAPQGLLARIQLLNGGLTLPIIGGIWILAFIFMFLVPSREASFRGQETLERGVNVVKDAIENKLAPAAEVWVRVGKKVEESFPSVLEDIKRSLAKVDQTMEELRVAAVRVKEVSKIVDDMKPALDSLKRIEVSMEREIKGGIFEEIRGASRSIQTFGGLPPDEENSTNLNWAIDSIKKQRRS